VKTASAQELARKGREEAFQFFIDAIGAHRFYRQEVERWLRETYRLPAGLTDVELIAFLNDRIRTKQAAAVRESPARDAVAKLQSANSAERKAAAKVLLDLAPQSPLAMNSVAASLVQDVIRRPELVNGDTWFDAAVILGRLGQRAGLELYLERDGATAGLIELGERAVPDLRDVLRVAGPTRRRLAAEVLGAIGGVAARDALTAAFKWESDAGVKRAIQTALSQLGQRPAPVEIR
jgi:HEAT repeat protein